MNIEYVNLKYILYFLNTFKGLVNIVKFSINDYYKNKPNNHDNLPNWMTPKPWENKVLKNLEKREILINDAYEQFKLNNSDNIYDISSDISSLGKDLDNFSLNWMTDKNKMEFEKMLDNVIQIASNIERSF